MAVRDRNHGEKYAAVPTLGHMLDRALDWLYRRLGRKYWVVLAVGRDSAAAKDAAR